MKISVLVVDDELLIRKSLGKVLRARGYVVDVASTGAEGLDKVGSFRPQVMILDMRLPDGDGLTVLSKARQLDPLLQVIIITAYGDVQTAVDAMKLGACDFVRKPYEMEDIVLAVESAGRTFRQASELDLYRRRAWQHYSGEEIIGQSNPMREVRALIDKELFERKGRLEGGTLKAAFADLTRIYHAENAHSMPIKPPQMK